MAPTQQSSPARKEALRRNLAALAGLLLGLALLKFGNPAILDRLVSAPTGYLEFVYQPWPLAWGYLLMAAVLGLGCFAARWQLPKPWWATLLPLAWLGWVAVSAMGTIDPRLTGATLPYLASCVAAFYLGLFGLAPARQLRVFWLVLLGCFTVMLVIGFQQRFGGLEETRQQLYSQAGGQSPSPELLKRAATGRIFATQFYPNALAGVLLLLLPGLAVVVWRLGSTRPAWVRVVATAAFLLAGLACLYWSRSKTGWLIAIGLGALWLLRLPVPKRAKLAAIGIAVVLGMGAFSLKFRGYFQSGASSFEARQSYWAAGWSTACANPLFGTGPGTFAVNYRRLKAPEAEMALLAHNDYLQQASDSGFPGAALYLGVLAGSLACLWRSAVADPLRFGIWSGLAAWACQGFMEFGLFLPSAAWSAFLLLGWLWGTKENSGAAKAWTASERAPSLAA